MIQLSVTIIALTLLIEIVEKGFEIRSQKQQIGYMVDENGKAITLFSLEEGPCFVTGSLLSKGATA